MYYDPDVPIDANRPEILVLGLIQLMKAMPRIFRIHLHIKCSRFDYFLLIAGQLCQARGECICNSEFQIKASFQEAIQTGRVHVLAWHRAKYVRYHD